MGVNKNDNEDREIEILNVDSSFTDGQNLRVLDDVGGSCGESRRELEPRAEQGLLIGRTSGSSGRADARAPATRRQPACVLQMRSLRFLRDLLLLHSPMRSDWASYCV